MICVAGVPGSLKPSPIPDELRILAAPKGGEGSDAKAAMLAVLKEVGENAPVQDGADVYTVPLSISLAPKPQFVHDATVRLAVLVVAVVGGHVVGPLGV